MRRRRVDVGNDQVLGLGVVEPDRLGRPARRGSRAACSRAGTSTPAPAARSGGARRARRCGPRARRPHPRRGAGEPDEVEEQELLGKGEVLLSSRSRGTTRRVRQQPLVGLEADRAGARRGGSTSGARSVAPGRVQHDLAGSRCRAARRGRRRARPRRARWKRSAASASSRERRRRPACAAAGAASRGRGSRARRRAASLGSGSRASPSATSSGQSVHRVGRSGTRSARRAPAACAATVWRGIVVAARRAAPGSGRCWNCDDRHRRDRARGSAGRGCRAARR